VASGKWQLGVCQSVAGAGQKPLKLLVGVDACNPRESFQQQNALASASTPRSPFHSLPFPFLAGKVAKSSKAIWRAKCGRKATLPTMCCQLPGRMSP